MQRRTLASRLPVHRHSFTQLVVDAVLVAAAYILAFHFRFDADLPARYDRLLWHTLPWVVPICLAIYAIFGLYAKWWRYATQRDYETILQAVVVSTFAIVGLIAVLHPIVSHPLVTRAGHTFHADIAVTIPTGVAVLFFLLQARAARRRALGGPARLRASGARRARRARTPAAC